MRVALLGPANSIHLQRWAAALVQRGHTLCVISQQRCQRALLPAAAAVEWLPHAGAVGYFRNARPLRALLGRFRPDLLNAHYASGYGSTAALAGFAPTLLSVWGSDVYDFPYQSRLKGWLLRRNLRHATAIASTSEAMAAQVRRLVPDCGDIAVTPFGVDLDRFRPRPARGPGAPLTVGIVKTLAPKYGVDLLLRAFAGLLRERERRPAGGTAPAPPVELLVVGDGPQRGELEALARQLGIAGRTRFAGAVAHAEVPAWLHRLDVYAAPSRLDSESFGVAVVEAGACALPVVVSDAGGLPEVVRDGETGFVVPRGEVPALQAALGRLLLDAALREAFGRAGRAHVARCYEWGGCVDRMERCFEATLRRAGRR